MIGWRQARPGTRRIIVISLVGGTLILLAGLMAIFGPVVLAWPVAVGVPLGLLAISVRQLDIRNARPILIKEMRSRMRGTRTPLLLLLTSGAAVLVALLIIASMGYTGGPEAMSDQLSRTGQTLFTVVSIITAIIVALVTPAITSGVVAHEYETQTFDFLLITPLSEAGILGGKLLAGLSFAAMLVVCTVPVTALAFFFGGVAPWQLFAVPLFILLGAYGLGTISLYCSARFRKVAVATTVAYVLCVLLLGLQLLTEMVPYEMQDGLQVFFGVTTGLILLALLILGVLAATSAFIRRERAQRFFLLKRVSGVLLTVLVVTVILLVLSEGIDTYGEFLYGNPGYSLYLLVGEHYDLEEDWPSVLVSAGAFLLLALFAFRKARYLLRCQRVQPPKPEGPRLRFRLKPW